MMLKNSPLFTSHLSVLDDLQELSACLDFVGSESEYFTGDISVDICSPGPMIAKTNRLGSNEKQIKKNYLESTTICYNINLKNNLCCT